MFKTRRQRSVPLLNTTSTADISFMLLIFFLVTTSMDGGKGITRELPPLNPQEQQVTSVQEGNVLHIDIRQTGQVFCNGKETPLNAVTGRAAEFIREKGDAHIIQLQSDRKASYDTYYKVQSAVQNAYLQLRGERTSQIYHCAYDQLTDDQKQAIDKALPQRVAEVYDQPEEREGKQ